MRQVIPIDLLSVTSGFIGHQVNCQGVMGAGVAKAIKDKYPIVFQKYSALCDSLGKSDYLLGLVQPVTVTTELKVMNLFGQVHYGTNRIQTDYDALSTIATKLMERDITIHLPYGMGCGLGGGDWDVVQSLFNDVKGDWYRLANPWF